MAVYALYALSLTVRFPAKCSQIKAMEAMLSCIDRVPTITFEQATPINLLITNSMLSPDSQVNLLAAIDVKVKMKWWI